MVEPKPSKPIIKEKIKQSISKPPVKAPAAKIQAKTAEVTKPEVIKKEETPIPTESKNESLVKELTSKLGIETTPELIAAVSGLDSNEQISEALVTMAVENGKSEAEISAAMS